MAYVHPTAIIDPQAELADDVTIGPFCIIEGPVRIGPGCELLQRVSLQGPLTLGEGNLLYPGVCIGFAPQDVKFDRSQPGAGVAIGARNIFREGVTIHRATGGEPTRVGHDNMLMANSHLGHDVRLGDRCTLANGALVGGHCEIQDMAILSGNSAVHQFCRIGRLVMHMGCAAAIQDVPPFCTTSGMRSVGGINRVGLRRAGLGEHANAVKRAFELLYRRRHMVSRAVDIIEQELGDDPLCMEMAAFVRSSKRGITPFRSQLHGAKGE